MFGGAVPGDPNARQKWTVGQEIYSINLTEKKWVLAGIMQTPRFAHQVLLRESDFVVVGGKKQNLQPISTETCQIVEDKLECQSVEPMLTEYWNYPATMLIDENYCV